MEEKDRAKRHPKRQIRRQRRRAKETATRPLGTLAGNTMSGDLTLQEGAAGSGSPGQRLPCPCPWASSEVKDVYKDLFSTVLWRFVFTNTLPHILSASLQGKPS